jgi:hypothetical protein
MERLRGRRKRVFWVEQLRESYFYLSIQQFAPERGVDGGGRDGSKWQLFGNKWQLSGS